MSYRLVENLQKKAIPVSRACGLFEVSRSGCYAAVKRRRTAPMVCAASVHLRAAFANSGRTYGSRRLRSVWRRKFVHTTDSRHSLPVSPNVLARQFDKPLPNQARVSDITYLHTRSGWLYLAAVLDLHSRKIVGWAMAPQMPATRVCAALQMAIVQRNPAAGLVVHSDRGAQCASDQHQGLLKKYGLVGSMSRKGSFWDNAVMERFFLNLKVERVWQKDYANHSEAITDVADCLVGFYNSTRLHSKLGNLLPNVFERKSAIQHPIDVSEIT